MIILGDKKKMLAQILGPEEAEYESEGNNDSLHSCMSEFIDCVQKNDVEGAVQAFKAAFAVLEAKPHDEYPHGE